MESIKKVMLLALLGVVLLPASMQAMESGVTKKEVEDLMASMAKQKNRAKMDYAKLKEERDDLKAKLAQAEAGDPTALAKKDDEIKDLTDQLDKFKAVYAGKKGCLEDFTTWKNGIIFAVMKKAGDLGFNNAENINEAKAFFEQKINEKNFYQYKLDPKALDSTFFRRVWKPEFNKTDVGKKEENSKAIFEAIAEYLNKYQEAE